MWAGDPSARSATSADHVDVEANAAQQLGQPDSKVAFKEFDGALRRSPDRQGLHSNQVVGGHYVRDRLTVPSAGQMLETTTRERHCFIEQAGAEVASEIGYGLIRGDEAVQAVSERRLTQCRNQVAKASTRPA